MAWKGTAGGAELEEGVGAQECGEWESSKE